RTLPFGTATFDAIVAASVLEYVDNPCAVLGECARVLRPGGILVCTVPDPIHPARWGEWVVSLATGAPGIVAAARLWPLLVDTAASTYERRPVREYERSTAAHNTVEVDRAESTEVWGAFRAGRRARGLQLGRTGRATDPSHGTGEAKDQRLHSLLPSCISTGWGCS